MWQNNIKFLDIISIISFVLQLQNAESHEIERLRNEVSKRFDEQTKILLDTMNKKLDRIEAQLQELNARVG